MNNSIKKKATLYYLLPFIAFYNLLATEEVKQSTGEEKVNYPIILTSKRESPLIDGYCKIYRASYIPKEISVLIRCFTFRNIFEYTGKELPPSLYFKDLRGYNLKGCRFMYTNLTYTQLDNTILTDTVCDYQKTFEENYEKNQCKGGNWCKNEIGKELKSIAEIYPKLDNHAHKVKLLRIADRLSRLPYFKGGACRIKWKYYSSDLLSIKNKIGKIDGKQLFCSLEPHLLLQAKECCWITQYPQNKIDIHLKKAHTNFKKYLSDFESGIRLYVYQLPSALNYSYYEQQIRANIQALSISYSKIGPNFFKRRACRIAHELSKSYQVEGVRFLSHFLYLQSELVDLQQKTGIEDIFYISKKDSVIRENYEWL